MGNKFKIGFLVFLSIAALVTCTSDKNLDFYCDTTMDYSVWRIPVAEPYQLITVDSSSFWSLYCGLPGNYFQSAVDSVAYHKKQVLFFSGTGNVLNFGLLDTETGKITDFKTRSLFMEFRSRDSAWQNLYSVKDLFKGYLKDRSLPWSSGIPGYKECK